MGVLTLLWSWGPATTATGSPHRAGWYALTSISASA